MTDQDRILDLADRRVDLAERAIHGPTGTRRMTPTEAALLAFLANRAGESVSAETLLSEVWGYDARVRTQTLTSTVYRLRKKLEPDPSAPRHLVRTREGYVLQGLRKTAPEGPGGRFLGRTREIGTLLGASDRHMVLLGPGGVGKTRLARQWLARWEASRPEPALWVDLTATRTDEGVAGTVAAALNLRTRGEEAPADGVGRALRNRGPCVLVLDNCEQVAGRVGELVEGWSRTAPEARFLCTSRIRLGLSEERVIPVEPLPAGDALAMLMDRATAANPDWAGSDPLVVAHLAERLDRLPLAIELIATRARLFGPDDLARRLDQRFALVADRHDSGRHGALATVLRDSWELLEPAHQAALAQLAALPGPFDATLAEAVVALPTGAPFLADVLADLVDHSLVQPVSGPRGAPWFRILESVQAWTHAEAPEEQEAASARFVEEMARRSQRAIERSPLSAGPTLAGQRTQLATALVRATDQVHRFWLTLGASWVARDHGDPHAAWRSLERLDPAEDDAERYQFHLARVWANPDPTSTDNDAAIARGLAHKRGSRLMEALVDARSTSIEPFPADATAALEQADRARELDEPWLLERALRDAGIQLMTTERQSEASVMFQEAASLRSRLGPHAPVSAEVNLAITWSNLGRHEEAAALLADVAERIDPPSRIQGLALVQLGRVRYCLGQLDTAVEAARRGERVLRVFGDLASSAAAATDRGAALLDLGDHVRAEAAYREAAALYRRVPGHWGEGVTHAFLGRLFLDRGDPEVALAEVAPWLDDPLQVTAALAQATTSLARVHLGEVERGRAGLAAALAANEPAASRAVEVLYLPSAALLDHLADRPEAAEQALARAHSRYLQMQHRMGLDTCAWLEARFAGRTTPSGLLESSFLRAVRTLVPAVR